MLTAQALFAVARRVRDAQRLDGIVLGLDAGAGPRVAADGACAPGDVLPWGSVTKVVNAAAVVATGCDLDRPVHRGATRRHLLSHAGGLAANGADQLLPPGRGFGYSNVGVLLAAQGVDAALESVLGPLDVPVRSEASVSEAMHRAGGLAGTAEELLRVGTALGGPQHAPLQRPRIPAGSYAGAASMGWFVDDLAGEVLLRHEGRTPAGCAVLARFGGATMAVLVPGEGTGAAAWMGLRALLADTFDLDPDSCRPQPDGSTFEARGRFTTGGVAFELAGDLLQLEGTHRLVGCGPATAKVTQGPRSGTRVDVVHPGHLVRLDGRLAWRV